MPCDRITTQRLALEAADHDRLKTGALADGLAVYGQGASMQISDGLHNGYFQGKSIDVSGGTTNTQTDFVNRIRRAYSRQTVLDTAKRLRWRPKFVGETGNRIKLQRRF